MTEAIVEIGKITSAFGIKGWVKIFSFTEPKVNILDYQPWLLQQAGAWREIELLESKVQGKGIAAKLSGVDDRTEAEALSGCLLAVKSEQLPKLSDDDYYWRDLEGLQVINTQGVDFGRVSHLIATGSNDVLVVHGQTEQQGKLKKIERMVPFTPEAIKQVDIQGAKIIVEWDADF